MLIRDLNWCIFGIPWIIRFSVMRTFWHGDNTYHVTVSSAPIRQTVDSMGLVMVGTQTSKEALGANNGEA